MSATRKGTVAVIGAGFYGSTTALRLAEYDIFERSCSPTSLRASPKASRST